MRKRITSAIAVVALAFSLVGVTAVAAEAKTGWPCPGCRVAR